VELPKVDLEHLKALMKLMEQFQVDTIDLREEGRRLHLSRGGGKANKGMAMPTIVHAAPAHHAPAPAPSGGAGKSEAAAEPGAGIKVIRSPMVGTFYRSPSPEASSFVEEGQQVSDDTVLCIIEAMKVMNEIKAECAGELVKILVANGEAVEYGEPLFHVRAS
jgi:acetyl-CoA carboxylase biotin carboxyl carrier protein